MKNLVFQFYLTVTLCWQSGIAERSANGYFYDKPEGTLFEEEPGTSQLSSSAQIFPPQQPPSTNVGYYQQLLPPPPSQPSAPESINESEGIDIIPGKLVYEDSQSVDPTINFRLQQENSQNFQNYANTGNFLQFQPQPKPQLQLQPQQIYRGSRGDNLQPVAFEIQDGSQASYNSVKQSCGPEPIVAQFNPNLVDLANGGPLTRLITTCGPNNDCSTIALQSDLNRQLGVLPPQSSSNYHGGVQQGYQSYQLYPVQPRTANVGIHAVEAPLVRPPGRRLIQYSEIERDDAYN